MCGIFGVIGKRAIAESIYYGLTQMQHRGQDAAGIFTYDPETDKHAIHKDIGLVKDVFTTDTLPLPNATWGIGHVRYATVGKGDVDDAQPLYMHGKQTIAMAQNGNIVNFVQLRDELRESDIHFETASDLEVILRLFSAQLPGGTLAFNDLCRAVRVVHEKVSGAYSIVAIIGGVGLFAFRDPWGIRPLLMGYNTEEMAYAFSSETNSLEVFGCREINDVRPGELVFIDKDHHVHRQQITYRRPAHCSFEYNYFSKPNTTMDHSEVYSVRSKLGKSLGNAVIESGIDIDVVIPIPSTARPGAITLAEQIGVPYREGFVKQDYIGRTFIMPTQGVRQQAMKRKLSVVPSVFRGKSVLLVDDSVVRGTVSKRVVSLARWAGAERIYFASTFAPIRHPCLYGIDFPNQSQLIAADHSLEKIAEEIGVERIFYNTEESIRQAVGTDSLCTACVTGEYPTCTSGKDDLQGLRQKDLKELEQACLI